MAESGNGDNNGDDSDKYSGKEKSLAELTDRERKD
jgi:hypothetical protein